MSRKGRWMKDGEGEIIVDGEIRDDFLKVRKKNGPLTELQPQHKKVSKAGKEIAKRCKGLTGGDFVTCRSDVLDEIFPDRHKE